MSDDKYQATFHGGQPADPNRVYGASDRVVAPGALPQRDPFQTFAQHGAPPPPVNPGRNAEAAPGVPPWGTLYQDIGHQPPKRRRWWVWALVVVAVLTLCGFGALALSSGSADKATAPAATSSSTSPRAAAPTVRKTSAAPAAPSAADGIYHVGEDIPAGVYRTRDAVSAGECYWMKSSDSEGQNIISNDLPSGGRPQVTLKSGQWFTSRGCGTWVRK